MKPFAALIVAAGLVGMAAPAHAATVLNFDALASDGTGVRFINQSQFEYDGFRFLSGSSQSPIFGIFGRDDPRNADPGGATIYHRWSNTPLSVSRTDGAAFDLMSIDFADLEDVGLAVSNLIQFYAADGSVLGSTEFTLDGMAGLQTITFNQRGISSFAIYAPTGGWTQFDNMAVGQTVSAVPEPGVWAMMIAGFFTLGSALRRNRRRLAVA